jgi:hypothetical protein
MLLVDRTNNQNYPIIQNPWRDGCFLYTWNLGWNMLLTED